jgi:two-component system nitrogen regulation response regulator GlnG
MECEFLMEALNKKPGPLPTHEEVKGLDIDRLVLDLLQAGEPEIYRKVSLAVDRATLRAVLGFVKGNQVRASELLGISRTTLRAKLRLLGMTIEKQILAGPQQP